METKAKFRELLREHVKKTVKADLGNLPPTRQSKEMTKFYVTQVLTKLTPGLVPTDEDDLENCIIDGSDDCGVDFLFRNEGSVLIIQSKFRGVGLPEKADEFTHFCEVLRRLAPKSGSAFRKNQKLMEAITDIDWENDYFDLQFITLGRVGDNVRTREKEGASEVAGLRDLADRCEIAIFDESLLNMRLREALSAGGTISEPVPLRFLPDAEGCPWLKVDTAGKRRLYCGVVSGAAIAELYRPHSFRLFAMNIRDWIGDTTTNKGIVHTAEHRPEDFLFFNNGISAVATSIEEEPDEHILRCKNFSIINGAQTVRSLSRAQARSAEAVKKARVAVRISTFSLGKEASFLEEVTRYNNTQNKVAVSDFRSNDPVQKDLARRFEELTRGGLRFWYKNKRSRERRDRIPIEMEEFAKTIHAFKYGPHDMWGGTAHLFDTGKSGRYAYLFGDGESIWAKVPEEEFRLLAGIWFLCEEVRRLWKKEKEARGKDDPGALALERRYIIYFAVGELLRICYTQNGRDLAEEVKRLSRVKWMEKDGRERAWIRQASELAFTALAKAYGSASRSKEFRHRNWFRDRDYLEGIRSELRFICDIMGKRKDNVPLLGGDSEPN